MSNYDKEISVASLSNIQSNAKLLQTEKTIPVIHCNTFFLDNRVDAQTNITQQSYHISDF